MLINTELFPWVLEQTREQNVGLKCILAGVQVAVSTSLLVTGESRRHQPTCVAQQCQGIGFWEGPVLIFIEGGQAHRIHRLFLLRAPLLLRIIAKWGLLSKSLPTNWPLCYILSCFTVKFHFSIVSTVFLLPSV